MCRRMESGFVIDSDIDLFCVEYLWHFKRINIMAKNVTYLLGAGASGDVIPTVNRFLEELQEMENIIRTLYDEQNISRRQSKLTENMFLGLHDINKYSQNLLK